MKAWLLKIWNLLWPWSKKKTKTSTSQELQPAVIKEKEEARQKIWQLIYTGDVDNIALAFQLMESQQITLGSDLYEFRALYDWLLKHKAVEKKEATFQEELEIMMSLKRVDFYSKRAESVPSIITTLPNLESLVLNTTLIDHGGEFNLLLDKNEHSCLNYLDLRKNNLKEIPPSVFKHQTLTILALGANAIKEITDEIALLSRLTSFSIMSNRLESVPEAIGQLSSLESLFLGANKFLLFPTPVLELKNLTFLSLGMNELTELPSDIKKLSKLTNLHLSRNNLTTLPKEIALLPNLRTLELEDNQLRKLPKEISQVKNLKWLKLRGNPIASSEIDRLREEMPHCNIKF